MAIRWYAGYGGYNNTGPYNNVLLVGSPTDTISGLSNVNLTNARAKGYGQGVGFEQVNNTQVRVYVSMVAQSVLASGQLISGGKYVPFGGTYNYFVKLSVSRDNQNSWEQVYLAKDVSHGDSLPLYEAGGWEQATFRKNYVVNIPETVTHIKFEIYGENASFPHENIFTRQQFYTPPTLTTRWVKGSSTLHTMTGTSFFPRSSYTPTGGLEFASETTVGTVRTYYYADGVFKPWATRKSGTFKSHQRNNGWFRIRRSGAWVDVSTSPVASKGQVNQGTHRIRKSGSWKGQSDIGG